LDDNKPGLQQQKGTHNPSGSYLIIAIGEPYGHSSN
jgi:hypothetical protein